MKSRDERGFAFVVELILVAAVLVIVALAAAQVLQHRTAQKKQPAAATPAAQNELRGVAVTPKTYDAAGFADFYQQAEALGTSVSWHGDWSELGNMNGSPYMVAKAAREHGLETIVLVGTHHEVAGKAVASKPLDSQALANYKRWAVDYVSANKPRYFGMGNEVNLIAATAPADFEVLVGLVNNTAAAVKAASPSTKTFVTYQLERMKGLNGGLFGGANDPTAAQWDLLKRFDVDIQAFTTYPGLIYHSPSEIPTGYYAEIRANTTKPVAFSEVGWSADRVAAGWESNPAQQSEFAGRFLNLTDSLGPEFRVWLLLYDIKTPTAFASMGLIDTSGVR